MIIVEQNVWLHFDRPLNGWSKSFLVTDPAGARWVLKSAQPPPDHYGLINEVLGWHFSELLGVATADHKLVSLANPNDFKECVQSAQRLDVNDSDLYFLSRFIPDVHPTCYELLPSVWLERVSNRKQCLKMFIFDRWANHTDRRQSIFVEDAHGLAATFIDNSHLFGGPNRMYYDRPSRLSAAEIVALSLAQECGVLRELIDNVSTVLSASLCCSLEVLPKEWRSAHTQDRNFFSRYKSRLTHLEDLVSVAIARSSTYAPPFRANQFCWFQEGTEASCIRLV